MPASVGACCCRQACAAFLDCRAPQSTCSRGPRPTLGPQSRTCPSPERAAPSCPVIIVCHPAPFFDPGGVVHTRFLPKQHLIVDYVGINNTDRQAGFLGRRKSHDAREESLPNPFSAGHVRFAGFRACLGGTKRGCTGLPREMSFPLRRAPRTSNDEQRAGSRRLVSTGPRENARRSFARPARARTHRIPRMTATRLSKPATTIDHASYVAREDRIWLLLGFLVGCVLYACVVQYVRYSNTVHYCIVQ